MGRLHRMRFGNSVRSWLIAIGIVGLSLVGLRMVQAVFARRLQARSARTVSVQSEHRKP